jgi:hypothetical protein
VRIGKETFAVECKGLGRILGGFGVLRLALELIEFHAGDVTITLSCATVMHPSNGRAEEKFPLTGVECVDVDEVMSKVPDVRESFNCRIVP